MSETIHKYVLHAGNGGTLIQMPREARVLSVGVQRGNIVVWALIDTENEFEARLFLTLVTGAHLNNFAARVRFLGTVQIPSDILGELVYHVFEHLGNSERWQLTS